MGIDRLGMPTLIELGSLVDHIRLCREFGLGFIELNMEIPPFAPHFLGAEELRATQEREGIRFTAHLPEDLNLAHFQPTIRQAHLRFLKECIDWATESGISLLNMHLHPGVYFTLPDRKVWVNDLHREEFLHLLYEGFDDVTSYALQRGVTLCVENTRNFSFPFIRDALEQLVNLPGFHLTWDTGHDARADFVEEPVFRRFSGRVRHMHLHDFNDAKGDHQPLFTGVVPVEERLAFARGHGSGVVIEVKDSRSLRQSVEAIKHRLSGTY